MVFLLEDFQEREKNKEIKQLYPRHRLHSEDTPAPAPPGNGSSLSTAPRGGKVKKGWAGGRRGGVESEKGFDIRNLELQMTSLSPGAAS